MSSAAEPIRIALELYSEGNHLSGALWRRGGTRHAFSGWTGLAAALSVAIEEPERETGAAGASAAEAL